MMYSEFMDIVKNDEGLDHVLFESLITENSYHEYIEPVYNYCTHTKQDFCVKFIIAFQSNVGYTVHRMQKSMSFEGLFKYAEEFNLVVSDMWLNLLRNFYLFPRQFNIEMET